MLEARLAALAPIGLAARLCFAWMIAIGRNPPVAASLRRVLLSEDWWAVWLGWAMILAALGGLLAAVPKPAPWTSNPFAALPGLAGLFVLLLGLAAVTALALAAMRWSLHHYLAGFPVVFLLAALAQLIASQKTVEAYGLEYVLWALLLGLAVSNLVSVPAWLAAAARTELFIKTGLVLLGAEILFGKVLSVGVRGLGVGWLVPPLVLVLMYFFGTRTLAMKSKPLVATIAAETAVCGVSAAIAVGAATRAKREEISYAISLCLMFTVAMMILMPALARLLGLSETVAGAWIGGTVDSTGAVVAAGALLGGQAMETAAVVKMIQNTLIGMVAFVIAVLWVTRVERRPGERPRAREIWERFPKFILGFVLASFASSALFAPALGAAAVDSALEITKGLRGWLFALAFVSIGLESNFRDLARTARGLAPIVLYVVGQTANVLLSLAAAWWFFG
jgi:uncharacterized integral membrane protein (TIGR00698 family)